MKKSYILLIFTILSMELSGQHLPKFSLYEVNKQLINPAAPAEKGLLINAFHKKEWAGFESAPQSSGFALYQRLKKSSVGLYYMNDNAGVYNQNLLHLNYSHDAKLSPDVVLNLGGSVGFDIYQIRFNQLNLADLNDPKLPDMAQKAFVPDFNFGIFIHNISKSGSYVYSDNEKKLPIWYFGISFQHLVNLSYEADFLQDASYFPRHYYALGGFMHKLNDDFQMEENFLLKYVSDVPFQADFGVKVYYKFDYWTGLSYRTSNDILLKAGFDYKNILFGYAYAYSINKLIHHNSHEISLGYIIEQFNFVPKY